MVVGKLTPDNSKNVKVFKCHDTPIADEVAEYLGVKLGKMSGMLSNFIYILLPVDVQLKIAFEDSGELCRRRNEH